ncbi:MAG: hypothetical protein FWF51_10820 [Chitinivibrionia bacterium]|nr:hypothetical protein [Chitinivibrionia bacterium]
MSKNTNCRLKKYAFYQIFQNFYLTTILNGKLNFNGDFSGELVFNNFKYKCENDGSGDKYTLIDGNVRIGTFDVTENYIEFLTQH